MGKPSRNERNMPRKRYTPGLGRDSITPGRTAKVMLTQKCKCGADAVFSRPKPEAPHTYVHLCMACARLTGKE